MLVLLSPAKKQNFSFYDGEGAKTDDRKALVTDGRFKKEAFELIQALRQLDQEALGTLMSISPKLAQLNYERFQAFSEQGYAQGAPAVLAFQGDAYQALQADAMTREQLRFMQDHLRILSGLYGLLRPMDLIQPYRLEMKTPLANAQGQNLYAFWGNKITEALNDDRKGGESVVINLASQEYAKAINSDALQARLITIDFKVDKGQGPKTIGLYAKRARGLMVRYIIEHALTDPEALKAFDRDGYGFDEGRSSEDVWVFVKV